MPVLFAAALLALLVRSLMFQPFSIASGSMLDTIHIGDHLFVSKLSYGYSRYSFPFGLVPFEGRVLATLPRPGDIVVFRTSDGTDWIKRIVGMPGETVQMIGGVLHIDGRPVKRERVADFVDVDKSGVERRVPRYVETLPNGASYDTLDLDPNGFWDNTDIYEVPPGHFFTLGDNRDNSSDSRVLDGIGYVPFENLIGRADVAFYSEMTERYGWRPLGPARP